MINKLELINFQSHNKSSLEFHPGINAITGSSDSGKSAVLRSLYWIVNNRPSGDSFISYWARDKKGKQIEPTEVIVNKQGKEIKRFRDKDINGYKVDGIKDPLEAIGQSVPEQVHDFFNLSEVNIQKQLDAPFLLSNTPGEIARFFNQIIKLDEIDASLSLADKMKRDNNAEIKRLGIFRDETEKELKKYDWIPVVEESLNKAEKLQSLSDEKKNQNIILASTLLPYTSFHETIQKSNKLIRLEPMIKSAREIQTQLDKITHSQGQLKQTLIYYNDKKDTISTTEKYINIEDSMKKAGKFNEKIKEISENMTLLSLSYGKYKGLKDKITIINTEMKELKQQIPAVCPLCGGQLK
jgi:hypothetical protein